MNLLSKMGAFMAPFIISESLKNLSSAVAEVICSHRCKPAR